MDHKLLQRDVRRALELSDELSRDAYALGLDAGAGPLAALRTALDDVERALGSSPPRLPAAHLVDALRSALEAVKRAWPTTPRRTTAMVTGARAGSVWRARARRHVVRRVRSLRIAGEHISSALTSRDGRVPSRPLFGVLPLRRYVPQDVHSVMDYVASAIFAASAVVARTARARAVGVSFASAGAGVSLATDYRLSLVKVVPIEVHEGIDHLWGLSAALAPFALGYARRDRLATALQVAAGLGTIVASLFTDYRASRGVIWSRTLRHYDRREIPRGGARVVERPLEGLSSARRTELGDLSGDVTG